METLWDILGEEAASALLGLPGGLLLGLAARRARFCTLGAIEGAIYADDLSGLRMWAVALATAIFGAALAAAAGLFDPAQAFFMQLRWNPLASIAGGLMFGYGMALAGNCGYGALARLGGGDLRSFVVVGVLGVSAAMTAGGPLAPLRAALFPPVPLDPGEAAPGLLAVSAAPPLAVAALVAAALLGWALRDPAFRAARAKIFWATMVGVAVISGWALTGMLAEADLGATALASHSFADPLGESILWLMTASGGGMDFGFGSVTGVWLGALLGSWQGGQFRWEACEDVSELRRQIFGATLMGIGGVTAMGCSVGQGLTAFSLLHWGAPVTLAAIVAGAALGLRQLISGFHAI